MTLYMRLKANSPRGLNPTTPCADYAQLLKTLCIEALSCAPVNTQRSTDGIAVPTGLQRIVLGEDLDSFPLPAPLDWYTQPQGKVTHINPAVPCLKWLRHEDPEMSAPMTLLKRRLQPILPEVKTESTKGYGAATARLVGFTPPFSLTWQCEAAPFLS